MARLAKRWPERSISIGISVFVARATLRLASAQSSQVAPAPGSATPACWNNVTLTNAPFSVSVPRMPLIAWLFGSLPPRPRWRSRLSHEPHRRPHARGRVRLAPDEREVHHHVLRRPALAVAPRTDAPHEELDRGARHVGDRLVHGGELRPDGGRKR